MIFHNVLDNLLSDKAYIRTYKQLAHLPDGATGRELSRLIGVSPFKMHQILRHLVAHRIVMERVVGRSHLYNLNKEHILVKDLILYSIYYETSLLSTLGHEVMTRAVPSPLAAILYGSIARDEETPASDIDLLLVTSDDTLHNKRREEDGALIAWIVRTYGNSASIRRMAIATFQRKADQRDPFIRNVIKEGKSIGGLSLTEVLNYGRTKNEHGDDLEK